MTVVVSTPQRTGANRASQCWPTQTPYISLWRKIQYCFKSSTSQINSNIIFRCLKLILVASSPHWKRVAFVFKITGTSAMKGAVALLQPTWLHRLTGRATQLCNVSTLWWYVCATICKTSLAWMNKTSTVFYSILFCFLSLKRQMVEQKHAKLRIKSCNKQTVKEQLQLKISKAATTIGHWPKGPQQFLGRHFHWQKQRLGSGGWRRQHSGI